MTRIPLKQVVGAQPIAPNLTAISNISDPSVGLVEKTGAGTMATLTPSTVGRQLITGDAAAGRSAIGLSQMTFSGSNLVGLDSPVTEVQIKASSGVYYGATSSISAFANDLNGQGVIGLLARSNLDIGSFAIQVPSGIFQMRAEFRPAATWDGSSRQLQFFDGNGDVNPANRFVGIGKNLAQFYTPISAIGYQIGSGATQTASLRGSKTISTPSTSDTIIVAGASVGDIVSVSRGKDAYVSAANTVTFDSTGLGGVVVSAIVERFI